MKQQYDFSRAERARFFHADAALNVPVSEKKPDWELPQGRLGRFIDREVKNTLKAYEVQPHLVIEHANHEHDTAHGGYAHRQLFELVQNSADALTFAPNGGSVVIRLTGTHLYCADNGRPIDEDGIKALMFAHMSPKRGTSEIGRFGLGFKSVLGVTDAPEFFCRSGSFRFDREYAANRIGRVPSNAGHCPVLRLPEPIDPREAMEQDEDLYELASWATNIVRLPLMDGVRDGLARQICDFPPEFLLFVEHVRYLTLEDEEAEHSRDFILENHGDEFHLDTGEKTTRWIRCKRTHRLSPKAQADRRALDDIGEVPVWWAAPLDDVNEPGHFWAFFPTRTASLLAGIVNAPWKTNEDRQNLLPGPYNDEVIDAAAEMIAEALPRLATSDDPARHLDALPRRHEMGDSEQADRLRARLFSHLHDRAVIPDQEGDLLARQDVSYPPKELTSDGKRDMAPFERWAAYPKRPRDWLHHRAFTRNRLATIDRLFPPEGEAPGGSSSGAPRAEIAQWLEALVHTSETDDKAGEPDDAVLASMAAVQVAALIPDAIRASADLGKIVLTAANDWRVPVPDRLFLPDEMPHDDPSNPGSCVHPGLVSDHDTLSALKKLGLKPPSPESSFRSIAGRILKSGNSQEPDDDLH